PQAPSVDALVEHGRQLIAAGNARAALSLLQRALAAEPENGYAHAMYALALIETNQLKAAEREARLAVQYSPEEPFHYLALGLALKNLERLNEAERVLQHAIRLNPTYAQAYAQLAHIAVQRARWAEAERYARHALQLDPENETAHTALALSAWFNGRVDEAEQRAREGLRRNPEDADYHWILAMVAARRNDAERARQHSLDALAIDPTHEGAKQTLLWAVGIRAKIMVPALRFNFLLLRLPPFMRAVALIGFYLTLRVMIEARRELFGQPDMQLVVMLLTPLIVGLALFWLYLILVPPLFHWWLRRSRDARLREAAKH
ncbi:MAG: tetratricopeptide repeat protein, partial [Fimbriimonadales bacterium]|nr:tetratricopeptide repeat protein [Fimbriimonadales bacterium]